MVSLRNSAPRVSAVSVFPAIPPGRRRRAETRRDFIPTESFSWGEARVVHVAETKTPRVPVVSVQQHSITPLPANLE